MSAELIGVLVANMDPVNAALLIAIYAKLRQEHRSVRDRVKRIDEKVERYH